jgi:hypothetical protein
MRLYYHLVVLPWQFQFYFTSLPTCFDLKRHIQYI